MSTSSKPNSQSTRFPAFATALRFWLRLGFISFGGPAGQIAIMHRELVEVKGWISERQFLHALNFCMLLPGPEAQQLATYLGWRLHGAKGGVVAGSLFVIPSLFILFGLSWVYMVGGGIPWLTAVFNGLIAAVIAVVLEAGLRIGRRALKTPLLWAVAGASFVAIYFFGVSFVFIVLGAGLLGGIGVRFFPRQFPAGSGHGVDESKGSERAILPPTMTPTWSRAFTVTAICLVLWWGPVLLLAVWLGWKSTPVQQGAFFSKAALVTFGGAYAVLPYVAQQAVENHGWLTHPQMMAGLALAETTPGPLIMVLQFVGFVGGWQHAGEFSPLVGATIGSLITTWVTFLPCFLFIFLGGPHIEKIGELPRVSAALSAITASVVGVILNLGVSFGLHALWPERTSIDWLVAGLAVAAFIALKRFNVALIPVIGACGFVGWLAWLIADRAG